MPVTDAAVLDALTIVKDPDLHRDIVSLGFIKDLRIDGGRVAFTIELTTPACPVKEQMRDQARAAVQRVAGVSAVDVKMSARVREAGGIGDGPRQPIPGVKNIIAVGAGKGGVGKTTVAVNLALALAKCGSRVGIIDGDIYGPNVPIMLGMKTQLVTDGQKIVPAEKFGLQVISMGFLTGDDAPIIWRGPMLHGALQQFFREVRWTNLDYLIVDMPPGTGDVALSLSQSVPTAGAIVVTTPQQVSLADSRRAVAMYKKLNIPTLGVIENMSYFSCPNCQHESDIFGHGGGERMAAELGVPFLGRIPIYQPIREGSDAGVPLIISEPDSAAALAFIGVAEQTAAQLSIASYTQADDSIDACAMNIPFIKQTLDNGLDVLLHEDHACPIVAVNIWYHVGSKNEQPGRTGFAHLFEHLMFEGSQHHDHGYFQPLQGAGASLNGSTNADRTNYWEVVPSNALELALWMESDRMGFLLPALTDAKFSNQRDVVLNERRQNYENRPYGLAPMVMLSACIPPIIPITGPRSARSPTSMRPSPTKCAGSSAPTTTRRTRRWRWPATSIPKRPTRSRATTSAICRRVPAVAPVRPAAPALSGETRLLREDRVELPRLYLAWHSVAMFGRMTPTSISPPTCSPTARPRGYIAGWFSISGLRLMCRPGRIRAKSPASSRLRRLPPRALAARARSGDCRRGRQARGRRTDRRRNRSRPRPGRIAVHVPAADRRRLRRQIGSAERLQRLLEQSGVFRSRSGALPGSDGRVAAAVRRSPSQ